MGQLFALIQREYLERVRSKWYLFRTALGPLFLCVIVLVPMFLFSATFYPLATYPHWLQIVTQVSPLYHGVALERSLTLGHVGIADIAHVGVLIALGLVAMSVATRRLGKLLIT